MKTVVMKPKKVDTLPTGDQYIYELKYDGGSSIIEKLGNDLAIYHSNNGVNQLFRYPELKPEISKIPDGTYIAEICCQTPEAVGGEFSNYLKRQCDNHFKIQRRAQQYPITAMMYDITNLGKEDITNVSLLERKALLSKRIKNSSHIKLVEYYDNPEIIINMRDIYQIEGIVAKDINKPYVFKKRDGWFKSRFNTEETVRCSSFEEWSSENSMLKGIVLITDIGDRVNLPGPRRLKAIQSIKENGHVMVEVSKYGRRFPVVKRVL